MRRGAIVRLVTVGLVIGAAVFALAYFVRWLPESASKERGGIDFVFWFTTGICIFIFALVGSIIVYSVVKFRAAPDDDSDGPPIHGHTGLEIVWTAIPAVLVTAISVVSGVVLARNDRIPDGAMHVKVTGVQFAWSFEYTAANKLSTGDLHLPKGRTTVFDIGSKDVIHSFWVPEFGQKLDALPGQSNELKVTPTKTGTFPIICTELCGLGHSVMRSQAIVMEPAAFDAWLKKESEKLDDGGGGAGKAVFANQGCGACHTLKAAGATATVGPDLDKLPEEAQRAGKPLEEFVRESIVDPNEYIEPGFPKNVMPPNYEEAIPREQLDALVGFLVESSREAK